MTEIFLFDAHNAGEQEMTIESTDELYDALVDAHSVLLWQRDHDGWANCRCHIATLLRSLTDEHCMLARMQRKRKRTTLANKGK